jgi:hypothetical protein
VRSHFRPSLEWLEDRLMPSAFTLNNQVLTVNGTAGNDWFAFSQRTIIDNNIFFSTAYTLSLNGETYTFQNNRRSEFGPLYQVTQIIVNGNGGNDSAVILTNDTHQDALNNTRETAESLVLSAGGGSLYLDDSGVAAPFLTFSRFNSAYGIMGNADSGGFVGTPGVPNLFVGVGSYSYMTAPGTFHYITGAGAVYGYAVGLGDVAYQYDGSGPSLFVASGNAYSLMSGSDNGQSFSNTAIGFVSTVGVARHAGDIALFYDSPLSDYFLGAPGRSTLSALNGAGGVAIADEAIGFDLVYAYSFVGGTDYATVTDSSHIVAVGFRSYSP